MGNKLVSARYVSFIKAKANKFLCKTMRFNIPELKNNESECYLAYHAPKDQKQGCVTIDLLNKEVDVFCNNDEPREEYLKSVVAFYLGGEYCNNK